MVLVSIFGVSLLPCVTFAQGAGEIIFSHSFNSDRDHTDGEGYYVGESASGNTIVNGWDIIPSQLHIEQNMVDHFNTLTRDSSVRRAQVVTNGCVEGDCLRVNFRGYDSYDGSLTLEERRSPANNTVHKSEYNDCSSDPTCIVYWGKDHGGIQWAIDLPPHAPPSDGLYLSYRVKFGPDFDFALGAKLPGLCGAREGYGCATGGANRDNGWSVRTSFSGDGKSYGDRAGSYVYFQEVAGGGSRSSGSGQVLHFQTGPDAGSPEFQFVPDQWYHIQIRVKVNSPGQRDGIVEQWIDAQGVYSRGTISSIERDFEGNIYQFTPDPPVPINKLVMVTFYGGNSIKYAPSNDSHIFFDEIIVSTKPIPHNERDLHNRGLTTPSVFDASGAQTGNEPQFSIDGVSGDGGVGTRWAHFGDGTWIAYDLGQIHTVSELEIDWFKSAERSMHFLVDTSIDGENWLRVFDGYSTIPTVNPAPDFEMFDVEDSQARYVKITGKKNSLNDWTSINEVRIWERIGVTASTYQSEQNENHPPSDALDGDPNTRWSAFSSGVEGSRVEQWIQYDLGVPRTVTSVEIDYYQGSNRTTDFRVEVSNDAQTWTSVAQYTSQIAPIESPLVSYNITNPVEGRYIRLVSAGNSNNGWNSINEWYVQ